MPLRASSFSSIWAQALRVLSSPVFGRPVTKEIKKLKLATAYRPEESSHSDFKLYCNVHLMDKFHGDRYVVLRKLGYGQYGTVWLAKDTQTQNHVALKMLRSDCYGGKHDIFELEMLKTIREKSESTTNLGRNRVSQILDHFRHEDASGEHVCFVFPVLGHNLQTEAHKYERGQIPIKRLKEIVRQLLRGLHFLHNDCGIIHTDLKPSNILFELDQPETLIARHLAEKEVRIWRHEPAESEASHKIVTEDDERPRILSEVISGRDTSIPAAIGVRIVDFGVSSWVDQHLTEYIQPIKLRAPEVILGCPWSTGVDIYSLGCLVIEFAKGHYAFPAAAAENGAWTVEDDRLAQVMEVFGKFPEEMLQKSSRREEFFDANGNLLRIPVLEPAPLSSLMDGDHEVLRRPRDMSKAEVPVFVDFLEKALAIDPRQRHSAAELLCHPWLHDGLQLTEEADGADSYA